MTMLTQENATEGQQEQVTRVAVDAARKAVTDYFAKRTPTKDGAQALHTNGNNIALGLRDKLFAMYDEITVTNKFASEEVSSSYVYPKEYRGVKPIGTQVDIIAKAFGLSLGYTSDFIEKVLPTLALPEGAEGWFAIPSASAIAKRHFPEVTDQSDRYCRAVELMLSIIGKSRSFYNYREGEITPHQLRQHARTLQAFEQIVEQQKGDILIVPAQFGMGHRGRSVRRARECFTANEFGLGALAVGSMALTHPERYVRFEQLHTDCAGDEFAPDAGGDFSRSPVFDRGDELKFGTDYVSRADDRYGSASGFVPQ